MQISENRSELLAELTVFTDKDGRNHCVVVAKGTFDVAPDGKARLSDEQEPFVFADAHFGDPGETSIEYECDFSPFKPEAEVLLHGHARPPRNEPVEEMVVELSGAGIAKRVRVIGDRVWEDGFLGLSASSPQPFTEMPLVYERAFGGSDHSAENEDKHGSETRNLVGVGFRANPESSAALGQPLPNLEDFGHPIENWNDTPPPVGFGVLSRNWSQRVRHAGTYDQAWMDHKLPFLPDDFDYRYFQSAAQDQRTDELPPGERLRAVGVLPDRPFDFVIPPVGLEFEYVFRNGRRTVGARLDTVILEPDRERAILVWRAWTPMGRKTNSLLEIFVHPRVVSESHKAPEPVGNGSA